MPRIVHIAIKVDDLEKATSFMKRCSAFAKPAQDTRAGMFRDTSQTETSISP
jgi:catechol 2,3-dioxygenase-like lactoylglutathione lyase family enzyme